jgi:hypothetical protein
MQLMADGGRRDVQLGGGVGDGAVLGERFECAYRPQGRLGSIAFGDHGYSLKKFMY